MFPQQGIHTVRKGIAKLEDVKGLKIRVGSRVAGQIAVALGAAPITLATSEMYEALQRGTVDGVFAQWTAFQPFKLQEVTFQHLDVPLGGAAGMIYMAEKKYRSLSAKGRKAIDDNSGEAPSREFGKFWDSVQAQGRADVEALKGHSIHQLPKTEFERWKQLLEPVNQQWAKSVAGGEKTLAMFRAELAKLQATPK
jgi:TRAP-type C4-dicarboxylate transport system substrate-binding protein